jgi:glycosyltransferase involved in cell wall biosynthesis
MNRIDMIIHELNHSGVSNAAVTLANGMVANKIPTCLVVIGEKVELPFSMHKNLEIKFLGIKRSRSFVGKVLYLLRSFRALAAYFINAQSTGVFAWGKEFASVAALARIMLPFRFKLVGVNVISISAHLDKKSALIRKILNFVYQSLLSKPEHIIAQSAGMVEELSSSYNIPHNKITVVYPPLQLKFFEQSQKKNKTNKILLVGRFAYQKNPFAALEILAKIKNTDAVLEFVGEGELEEQLKKKVAELGLESRVSFAGRQSDVIPYLKNSDVLILTSKYEGFGMVLAEAIACGVPVVSFDCPTGPAEIIIDGENGYLIPAGDIDLFAQMLDKALVREWDYKKIMQSANKFHPDVVIRQYLEVIEKHLL